jgi:FSR family fosmidomycin resistance protein-like MFS transporter
MAKSFAAVSKSVEQALQTRFKVLLALSFSHFLNDMLQSLVVALYPLIKGEFHLSFVEIGAISSTYQICASAAR